MTNDELKELLARAIWLEEWRKLAYQADYDLQPESVHERYEDLAQAVIDALAPMMREVASGLRCIASETTCELCTAFDVYPNGKYYLDNEEVAKQTLASLPDCWREVPKAPVIGSGCTGGAGRVVPEMVGGGGGGGYGYYVNKCSLGGCHSVVAHFVHGTSSGCKGAPKQSGFSFFKRSKNKQQNEKGGV